MSFQINFRNSSLNVLGRLLAAALRAIHGKGSLRGPAFPIAIFYCGLRGMRKFSGV